MISSAFPTLLPRSELAWLDQRMSLPCEELDEELRVCLGICSLVESVRNGAVAAQRPVAFHVRGAAKDDNIHTTNSPFYALVYRVVCCADLLLPAWTDPTDARQAQQLRTLLGIMVYVSNTCPQGQVAKMHKDMPRTLDAWVAACNQVELGAEWAQRIASPASKLQPLPQAAPVGATQIDWPKWRLIHDGTVLYNQGQYTAAARCFRDAQSMHGWKRPDPWVVSFMQSLKQYTDLPASIAAASMGPLKEETRGIRQRRGIPPLSIACRFHTDEAMAKKIKG